MSAPAVGPSPAGPGRTRARLVALGLLILAFGSGLAVGWGVGGVGRYQPRHGPRRGPPPPTKETFDRLNLSSAQRASIDSIFAARRAQVDEFWRGPGRRLRVILDSTAVDVRAVLDSSQKARFDAMRPERGPPPGGRPPGPPPFGPEPGDRPPPPGPGEGPPP